MIHLKNQVKNLEKWLVSIGYNKKWESVAFIDSKDVSYKNAVPKFSDETVQSIDQYDPAFSALLNKGYSWINLSALCLQDDELIVCVETPQETSGAPANAVSINFSASI